MPDEVQEVRRMILERSPQRGDVRGLAGHLDVRAPQCPLKRPLDHLRIVFGADWRPAIGRRVEPVVPGKDEHAERAPVRQHRGHRRRGPDQRPPGAEDERIVPAVGVAGGQGFPGQFDEVGVGAFHPQTNIGGLGQFGERETRRRTFQPVVQADPDLFERDRRNARLGNDAPNVLSRGGRLVERREIQIGVFTDGLRGVVGKWAVEQ